MCLEFEPPYVMSDSDSDGGEGPAGIGEPAAYWRVRVWGTLEERVQHVLAVTCTHPVRP